MEFAVTEVGYLEVAEREVLEVSLVAIYYLELALILDTGIVGNSKIGAVVIIGVLLEADVNGLIGGGERMGDPPAC